MAWSKTLKDTQPHPSKGMLLRLASCYRSSAVGRSFIGQVLVRGISPQPIPRWPNRPSPASLGCAGLALADIALFHPAQPLQPETCSLALFQGFIACLRKVLDSRFCRRQVTEPLNGKRRTVGPEAPRLSTAQDSFQHSTPPRISENPVL